MSMINKAAAKAIKQLALDELLENAHLAASTSVEQHGLPLQPLCLFADKDGDTHMLGFRWHELSKEEQQDALNELKGKFRSDGVYWYVFVLQQSEKEINFFIGTRFEFGVASAALKDGKVQPLVRMPAASDPRFANNFIEEVSTKVERLH